MSSGSCNPMLVYKLCCVLTTESITIILSDMAPFYEELCTDLKWPVDNSLLAKMQSNNEETFKKLDETLKDAEENLGETEIRDALYAKAEHLCKIGDKVQYYCIARKHNVNNRVLEYSNKKNYIITSFSL